MNPTVLLEQNPHFYKVTLLDHEVKLIEESGKKRNRCGVTSGFKTRTKDLNNKWHIHGFAGEYAVSLIFNSKLTNIESSDIRKLNSGDLTCGLEIKSSMGGEPRLWDLMETEKFIKPERIYVHTITHWYPECVVVTGWETGKNLLTARSVIGVHGLRVMAKSCFDLNKISTLFEIVKQQDYEK